MTALAGSKRMDTERLRVTLFGAVQGVGFRPFVFRLATSMGLPGWVRNSSAGLEIEVEGAAIDLTRFLNRLESERPPQSVVMGREISHLAPAGFTDFEILPSGQDEIKTAAILPDLATCPACRDELFDPADRRFLYPFINCTHCGPRYSIILDLPYDRPATTMRGFALCADCAREYHNPADRRFHAQPVACPLCGPRLTATFQEAARALHDGLIVAIKGIGGYQLLTDARQPTAVERLRQRKQREEKPFALMMPSLAVAKEYCLVSAAEAALLQSPSAPIVLLKPTGRPGLAPNVARSSPYLGVMLPYS
ncbi:MAG: Sua5/YciO/YrdC/YwlC family protein, partial [Acidobacteria bacterium]|nr:Sua5/YciO/YrdC/YwlC family protein [Acidobacteriota bacterium]